MKKRTTVFRYEHPCKQKKCYHFKKGKTPADKEDIFEQIETVCSSCNVDFNSHQLVYLYHPCKGCEALTFPQENRDCRGCEIDLYKESIVESKGFWIDKDTPNLDLNFSWEEREKDYL